MQAKRLLAKKKAAAQKKQQSSAAALVAAREAKERAKKKGNKKDTSHFNQVCFPLVQIQLQIQAYILKHRQVMAVQHQGVLHVERRLAVAH